MREDVTERTGFLFEGTIEDQDPSIARITAFEEARQVSKLIMIASESAAPPAVRQALGSVFTDLYAEGYPAHHTLREPEALVADIPYQVAYHERYGDRRYYKGTEFADLVEVLAQDRIRDLFAPNRFPHNPVQLGSAQIQANVQPLSGANANTAVYLGLLQAGDTIMGLNLSHGGHLSHGSPVNISGKLFKVVPYGVNEATGRIDYDEVERLAYEHNPRMIITGASAYPWGIDFVRLRQICDSLPRKAYLLADVSHPAGLVVAGLFPNPVGVADVTTFTTHKTLIGPRAAVILTTNETLARRIDRAVFPGLQGGPHVNTIAALAVAFKIAQTPEFAELQRTIVQNAKTLAETLARRGLTLAYGGTESHLLLVDLRKIPQKSGVTLNGDVAGRILDLAGVVCNKNTIIGDTSANYPSGIRLGTPWITQRGLTPEDMRTLGGVIADVLFGITTFSYFDRDESAARGKIAPDVLRQSQRAIADLIARRAVGPAEPAGWPTAFVPPSDVVENHKLFQLTGRRARAFLNEAVTGDVSQLAIGQAASVQVDDASGRTIASLGVLRVPPDDFGMDRFVCAVAPEAYDETVWWLAALSSGLVLFDPTDTWAKVDGPVALSPFGASLSSDERAGLTRALAGSVAAPDLTKPYFVGLAALAARVPAPQRPECSIPEPSSSPRSSPFPSASAATETAPGGWTMHRSYGDPAGELKAIREVVGLIDESALTVFEVTGVDASRFLDLVTTNDIAFLAPGAAQFTFLLDPRSAVVADALVYRVERERFLLTVNPNSAGRVQHWLTEALAGHCVVDVDVPTRSLPRAVQIRDARQSESGSAWVVMGLAGPNAPAVFRALADTPEDRRKIGRLRRFTLASVHLAGTNTIVARTGHTGVSHGYEIFLPFGAAAGVWDAALARGAEAGVMPVGWDAWRTAGIAAGLPWDGHEIGGPLNISPVQAGYGTVVRTHKPFFVGRRALLAQPFPPTREVARFEIVDPATRIQSGDLLANSAGTCVGFVTSAPLVEGQGTGLAFVETSSANVGDKLVVAHGAGSVATDMFGSAVSSDAIARAGNSVKIVPRFGK